MHKRVHLILTIILGLTFFCITNCRYDGLNGNNDEKSWGTAELIENDSGNYPDPQVAFDPSGNAVTVWAQNDGTRDNIILKKYIAGSGWQDPEFLETENGNARNPQIAFDASGNAIAVWEQTDGTRYNIYAKRYNAGIGIWEAAEAIDSEPGDAGSPQIGFDSAGNAIAVWVQISGGTSGTSDTWKSIWSNRYISGAGWQTAVRLEEVDWNAYSLRIEVDSSGNAIAIWVQDNGPAEQNIWSNRYQSAAGWQGPELLESEDGYAYSPQIAVDSSGNGIAVWVQNDGTEYSIWSNRYESAASLWQGAELIETGDRIANNPEIEIDYSGNAIALWVQQSDTLEYRIFTNVYSSTAGWQSARRIEYDDSFGPPEHPKIAADSAGSYIAVWPMSTPGSGYNIYSSIYTEDTGWQNLQNLSVTDVIYIGVAQIDIDPSGNAIAVWANSEAEIWANIYR